MLMPIEICARDPAGIEMSAPVRRALKRKRIPKVFIRNRLFSTFVRGSKIRAILSIAQSTRRVFSFVCV